MHNAAIGLGLIIGVPCVIFFLMEAVKVMFAEQQMEAKS